MDKLTLMHNHYTIRKLPKCKLYQLAEFMVYQNYRHHKKEKKLTEIINTKYSRSIERN